MKDAWQQLERAVKEHNPCFWWRDDDAAKLTPELDRLLVLSERCRVPVALAVVPLAATPDLFAGLGHGVSVMQHGTDHRNRAAPGEKKTEFPASERDDAALARLAAARARLEKLAGSRALPVFVPPWNRLRQDLLAKLGSIGIRGLSRYGAHAPSPGLRQVNTHVDIVAWKEGRRFIGEEQALDLALVCLSRNEPVGWLTHHAVHDDAAWQFLERLFSIKGIRWTRAEELFSYTAPGHG